jgi:hypothetical protein
VDECVLFGVEFEDVVVVVDEGDGVVVVDGVGTTLAIGAGIACVPNTMPAENNDDDDVFAEDGDDATARREERK